MNRHIAALRRSLAAEATAFTEREKATAPPPLSDIESAAWDIWQTCHPCEDGDHAAVPWPAIERLGALFAARLGVRLPDPTPPKERDDGDDTARTAAE